MGRAEQSERTFRRAQDLAIGWGLVLSNPSDGCYQLRSITKGWIINLYPRRKGFTPRVYHDPNHKGPFLRMREEWTLLDAVEAAMRAEKEPQAGQGIAPPPHF